MGQREKLIEAEVATWPEEWQAAYRSRIEAGESPSMAHMLVSQQAPTMGTTSDQQFQRSYRRRMETMNPHQRREYVQRARRAGIDVSGKYYVGGLGKPEDPRAWCASNDDVKRGARQINADAQGPGIDIKGDEPPPPKKVALAPDLVERMKTRYKSEDPALAEKCRKDPRKDRELTEKVIATHGKHKKD